MIDGDTFDYVLAGGDSAEADKIVACSQFFVAEILYQIVSVTVHCLQLVSSNKRENV